MKGVLRQTVTGDEKWLYQYNSEDSVIAFVTQKWKVYSQDKRKPVRRKGYGDSFGGCQWPFTN